MDIVPFISIGNLRFGESRDEVRSRLGGKHQAFKKDVGENETDAYDELGLHLYYSDDDKLEYVETFSPAVPTFKGIMMLGRRSSDVEDELARTGHSCQFMDDLTLNCGAAGIVLYIPDGIVQAVGAFRKGYFDD